MFPVILKHFLGLVAGIIALYLTVRTARAFATRTTSGLAAVSLAVVAALFWVTGVTLFAGPILGIILAFGLIAGGAALCAYWFPSARPYCVALAFFSALFVFLFASGMWLPIGATIGDL